VLGAEQALNRVSTGRPRIRAAKAMRKLRFIIPVLASSGLSDHERLSVISFYGLTDLSVF